MPMCFASIIPFSPRKAILQARKLKSRKIKIRAHGTLVRETTGC